MTLFVYQVWRTDPTDVRVITLIANAPARGSWQSDNIGVGMGERIRLRISVAVPILVFEKRLSEFSPQLFCRGMDDLKLFPGNL